MCMCLSRGGVNEEGADWMRGLGLGFANPVGTEGVLDVCLSFGCRGVVDVGGEWIEDLDQGLEGWVVLCLCELRVWILRVDVRSRCLCIVLADTCASEVHPVFNPVAPYGYLLPNMYLFVADITNPD